MNYSEEDLERFERYKRIHLKHEEIEQPVDQQLQALQKRDRNKWIQLLVNILAIIFFGYSYYFDITRLSNTFLYVLVVVFIINTVLIFYQKKQINALREYLQSEAGKT
jgi:undecaprenyl pyrophosphate phosphatase UppP